MVLGIEFHIAEEL